MKVNDDDDDDDDDDDTDILYFHFCTVLNFIIGT